MTKSLLSSLVTRLAFWRDNGSGDGTDSAPSPLDPKAIYLFPDTNFFHEHRDASEDYWLERFDTDTSIVLVLCPPIVHELDDQKAGHKIDRIYKSARRLNTLIRTLVKPGAVHTYRPSNPSVQLMFISDLSPDPSLSERIRYDTVDRKYVGCAAAFRRRHPNLNVQLLTGDAGPMAAATIAGLTYFDIPLEWQNTKRVSEAEKKIAGLERQLAEYKKTEPEITATSHDVVSSGKKNELPVLELVGDDYPALTPDEIDLLMSEVKSSFPMVSDYKLTPPIDRPDIRQFFNQWAAPSRSKIDHYQSSEYPEWLKDVRTQLETLHDSLLEESMIRRFSFAVQNCGVITAEDAEVRIGFTNAFFLRVPNDSGGVARYSPTLPVPPKAPQGEWQTAGLAAALDHAQNFIDPTPLAEGLIGDTDYSRDDYKFYWNTNNAKEEGDLITCGCKLWRHAEKPEIFELEIFPTAMPPLSGLITVEVVARNLKTPVKSKYRLEYTRNAASTYARGQALIQKLTKSE